MKTHTAIVAYTKNGERHEMHYHADKESCLSFVRYYRAQVGKGSILSVKMSANSSAHL